MRASAFVILSVVLLAGGPVHAADGATAMGGPAAGSQAGGPRVPAPLGDPVAGEVLEGLRGGERSTVVDVHNTGGVDGNRADGAVSGTNAIAGGAFGTSSGIVTVIQNSGANVLIQNGTSVNVQFVDPTP
jgi:hypothetical protein